VTPAAQPAADEPAADDPGSEAAALRALMAGPASPALGARIAAARTRWPGDPRFALLFGGWQEKSGDLRAAEASYRAAAAAHPANPWPQVRLLELLLQQRRVEEAAEAMGRDIWPGSAPESTRNSLLSRVTVAIAEMPARRRFLEGLLRGTAEDRFVLLKLAALCLRLREGAAAEAHFAAACALGPLPVESELLALELHLAATRFEEAHAVAQSLLARHPDRADIARRAIQAAHLADRREVMLDLLGAALRRWPRDWLLLFRFNRCTIPLAEEQALFAILEDQAPAMSGDERWLFQFVIACLRHGRVARAMAVLDGLAPTGAVAAMAMPLRAALRAHPPACWANLREVSNDPLQDVQCRRVPGAVATVVLLAGVQGGLGYLPFSLADGLLAQHRVNAVYLRDLNDRSFTAGVRGFGPDEAAMIAGLGALCRELGVPVITMGASIGGLAAIRAAALLGAPAAISFAGPLHFGPTEEAEPARPAGGARAMPFAAFVPRDLAALDLIRATPALRVHQCYGLGYAPDVAVAELLRGLPNATLHPVDGCADHFVIEHMVAGRGFFDLLETAIRMTRHG
jgi:hypothetical protein